MINDIPEDIINFEPPDYELEGSEVLEKIKEMPTRPIIPANREPTPMDLCYAEMRRKNTLIVKSLLLVKRLLKYYIMQFKK
jgi:hypothetical protein